MDIRHPDLEGLFGVRLGEIGWEQLNALVASRTEESEFLDFKQAFDQGPNADVEFGKDVCAFANARGGALIFGVGEENGYAKEMTPVDFSQSKEQQLRSWAHGRVFPSPEIDIRRIPSPHDPDRGVLLVIIAVSARQPHAVQKDRDGGLRYVVRNGRDTRTMTESEVADRYGRRFESIETRVQRLDAVFAARTKLSPAESQCWAAVALVPEVGGRFEVSGKTLKKMERRAREVEQGRNPFSGFLNLDVRAGFRHARVTALDQEGRPSEGYFEFHTDGAAFGARYVFMRPGSPRLPIGPNAPTILAGQLCREVALCLRRLVEHAKAAGCSGAALAKASVVGPTGLHLGFFGYDFVYYSPSEAVPQQFDPPPISIVLDDVLLSAQTWMVGTRLLLLDLFNSCGLPEVNPIHADGSLNSSEGQESPLLKWPEVSQVPQREADR